MALFAMQSKVLFHDTMAYGSQHHITNIKFQNLARETLLFGIQDPDQAPWQEQLKDVVMLTREAYSLNLAPVDLGERVGILMSYEDPTRSTVRLCFRIVHENGKAVACGFQTMILVHRVTGELIPPPPLLARHLDASHDRNLLEILTAPSFSERLLAGGRGVKEIMSPEMLEIGRRIAAAPLHESFPKLVDGTRDLGLTQVA